MPRVQRVVRTQEAQALPGARRQSAETSTSTGANAARARAGTAEALGSIGTAAAQFGIHQYSRLQQEARDQADVTGNLETDNYFDQFEVKRLYDPTTGALNQQGKAAFELPETIDAEFEAYAGEREKTLGTPSQQAYFAKAKSNRRANIQLSVRRHVAGEMRSYAVGELKATLANAESLAARNALDPRRAGDEIQRGVDAIAATAPQLGLGTEAVKAATEEFRSGAHVGIISNLLASEQTKAAQIYFDEVKGQIAGDKLDDIQKALKVGTVRKQGQQQADKIIQAGGTLTEQREKARAIDDPEIRDDAMARIEHENAVQQSAARETEAANLDKAFNIVSKTGSTSKIDPELWISLGAHQPALRAYAKTMAEGGKPQTNAGTFYRLMSLSADDPNAFAKENLLAYRNVLDDGDFNRIVDLQRMIKAGDTKATDKQLSGFRTNTQIFEDTLTQYGFDPKAKPESAAGKAIANLRRQLDLRVDAAQDQGQKVTNVEIQQTLDQLLTGNVTVKGSWWNAFPGGKSLFDTSKRLIELEPADVPAADKQQIESALRRANKPVNDQTVLDLYIRAQTMQQVK